MHELSLTRGTFVAVEICFKNRFHYVSHIPKDHFLGIALQFFFKDNPVTPELENRLHCKSEICFKNRFHYVSYIPKDNFLGIALPFLFFKDNIVFFVTFLKAQY